MAARAKAATAAKQLASHVHVAIGGERYVVFPAGTKVGDKAKVDSGAELVEFTSELAEQVTNPKAWAEEASTDADDVPADDE